MDIDAETLRVREHPEYKAMLRNLSDTQARCNVLLNALRDVKHEVLNMNTPDAALLAIIYEALGPPSV